MPCTILKDCANRGCRKGSEAPSGFRVRLWVLYPPHLMTGVGHKQAWEERADRVSSTSDC
jgi:hypothetical protein